MGVGAGEMPRVWEPEEGFSELGVISSFGASGSLPGASLDTVGAQRCRGLGSGGSERGELDSFSRRTSTISFSKYFFWAYDPYSTRGRALEAELGYLLLKRGSRPSRSVSKVLYPNVCSSESIWCVEADHTSFGPE